MMKNGVGYTIVNVVNTISPLLLIPLISNLYGVDSLGVYFAISLIVGVCFLIIDYSFFLISNRYSEYPSEILYKNIQSARLILLIICGLFTTVALLVYGVELIEVFSVLTTLTLYSMFPTWYFLLNSKIKLLIVSNFAVRLLPFVSVTLFYYLSSYNYFGVLENYNSKYLIVHLIFLSQSIAYFLVTPFTFKTFKFSFSGGKSVLNDGWQLFVADFFPNLYNNFPIIFLSYVSSPQSFASFNVGNRVIAGINSLYYSFSRGVLPLVKGIVGDANFVRVVRVVSVFSSLVISIVIIMLSKHIVNFFIGFDSADAVFILQYMALSLPFSVINLMYFNFFVVPQSLDKYYRRFIVKFSVFFCFISIFAIMNYQIYGMAIVLLISRVSLAIYSIFDETRRSRR
ncbi:lipopolysaccharide biosynthesis protein [Shewanella algae]|uniref:lipopolysaccharide biosynthesis protein n=1 Tax=Shewanella algae TaxID=38313 RepID=UPI00163ED61A|nr:hypothetical protein [Shewanella algae]QNH98442.1 hypothetical protein HU689_07400 [Shewanella algae]